MSEYTGCMACTPNPHIANLVRERDEAREHALFFSERTLSQMARLEQAEAEVKQLTADLAHLVREHSALRSLHEGDLLEIERLRERLRVALLPWPYSR